MEEKYGRPYSESHEDLRSFTRGIINFYKLGDKLAVCLDESNENLKELILTYRDTRAVSYTHLLIAEKTFGYITHLL